MSIEKLRPFLADGYENFPKGRTIGAVVLRTTQSETIFRTEGSGEPMCSEYVQAGIAETTAIPRLVMTKRKQVAPERRKGRELLRANDLLYKPDKSDGVCALNTNAPCEMCIDCFLYGFAAGGGGAQKSRVWTEDAFSVLPATELIGDRTINAIFETGTMRDENDKVSTALNTSEYIKPGTHFLDVVTFRDVTADELKYALGNILLTTRYGAVSSRVGRMENQILGVFGGISELPSSLELVQGVYDKLSENQLEHPLNVNTLKSTTQETISPWINKRGISVQLSADELQSLVAEVDGQLEPDQQADFLKRLNETYEPMRKLKANVGKDKGRTKKA